MPLTPRYHRGQLHGDGGEVLSTVGTAIAQENGPALDQFFLTFEQIGSQDPYGPVAPAALPPPPVDTARQPGLWRAHLRQAALCDVEHHGRADHGRERCRAPSKRAAVAAVGAASIDAFSASNQQAVAQLAIVFCSELVNNPTLSAKFFPGLNLSQPAGSYFATQSNMNLVINPLITNTQITDRERHADRDAAPGVGRDDGANESHHEVERRAEPAAGRTAAVTTAACAAVLGSAAVVLQ